MVSPRCSVYRWCTAPGQKITLLPLSAHLCGGVSAVQDVQVVHGSQRGAAGVGHEAEHMEVVTQFARCQQQHAAGVKRHGRNRLVGMGMEVSQQAHDLWVV